MGMFGGDWLGQMVNGHPMEAFGNNSKIGQAIDGQPAAILGMSTGGGDSTSAPPPAATAPNTSGSTGAPGINPNLAAGLGAAALAGTNTSPSNPLTAPQGTTPITPGNVNTSANPLQTIQPTTAPDQFSGTPFSQAAAPSTMAQIQHPQFQNFLQSLGNQQ